MAIAGYGDMNMAAQMHPTITTVRVERRRMGQLAVKQVLARLSGAGGTEKIVDVGFEIVQRESA